MSLFSFCNAARAPGEEPEQVVTRSSPMKVHLPDKDDDWFKDRRVTINCEKHSFQVTLGSRVVFSDGGLALRKGGKWLVSTDPGVRASVQQEQEIEDSDQLGTFTLINCTWDVEGTTVTTEIKVYKKQPVIAFGFMLPDGLRDCGGEDRYQPSVAFPVMTNESSMGLVWAFTDRNFSQPVAVFQPTPGPVVFYNENLDVVVVGPDRNFPESMIAPASADGIDGKRVVCGLEGNLSSIPADIWHETLLVFGNGLSDTIQVYGESVRMKYGKQLQSFDVDLAASHLGIWHDNGGHYYYNPGEFGNYEETLLAIKGEADELGIPYRYFQLDSWFYPKAGGRGGCTVWEADPGAIPGGVEALTRRMGMPCVCHARYFDASSPYAGKYAVVVEEHGVGKGKGKNRWALVDDAAFWDELMENCARWNCFCFEQDWMVSQWDFFDHLRQNLGAGNKWLAEMSIAAQVRDITIQYCMTPSNLLMASVQFPNVSHVRCSDDYHAGWGKELRFPQLTQVGVLAWSLGLLPFSDVQKSSTNPGEEDPEEHPLFEAITATLSCGPVGFGDQVGHQDPGVILQTCRPDGLLLKPDYPLRPADLMFCTHEKLYWTFTESYVGRHTWFYWLAVNLWPFGVRDHAISATEMGVELSGDYIAFDHATRETTVVGQETPVGRELAGQEHAFYVLAPMLAEEFALIGLGDKFATMSSQAVKSVVASEGAVEVVLNWVPGETFPFLVYDPGDRSSATVTGGTLVEREANEGGGTSTYRVQATARQTKISFRS
ncbi:MAG: hypothetical protein ACTSU5_07450 [Promethearchaeota archaeon]